MITIKEPVYAGEAVSRVDDVTCESFLFAVGTFLKGVVLPEVGSHFGFWEEVFRSCGN
jgi:hypothetical protein